MKKKMLNDLNVIFGSATIIDIDFSLWDKYISIIVITDHQDSAFRSSIGALIRVKFYSVSNFECDFPHVDNNIFEGDEFQHYVWAIDKSLIQKNQDTITIQLRKERSDSLPSLSITCRKIEIDDIHPGVLDKINPGWGQSPLVRRDVEFLYKMMQK